MRGWRGGGAGKCLYFVSAFQPAGSPASPLLSVALMQRKLPGASSLWEFFRPSTWRRKPGLRTDHPSGNPSLDF